MTFTDCNEYVDPGLNYNHAEERDRPRATRPAPGHVRHVRRRRAAAPLATGSDFAYQSGQFTIQPDGTFGLATLDLTNPTGTVNPAQVVGIGIQIYTGDICPYPNAGTPVVFNIDTVTD